MILMLPMAGKSSTLQVEQFGYPPPLIEISGEPMIQKVVRNLACGDWIEKIIYIVSKADCNKYHLDESLKLLATNVQSEVISIETSTSGALCSVMMAIDHVKKSPLCIANTDQVIFGGVGVSVKEFLNSKADAGCLTFQSVHPRWSFVKTIDGQILQAAEKKPISNNAIAGFYMYRDSIDFYKYANKAILSGPGSNGVYYISEVFNEYILDGKVVNSFPLENRSYYSFYNPQRIEHYEANSFEELL